jgi:hypothetical protein
VNTVVSTESGIRSLLSNQPSIIVRCGSASHWTTPGLRPWS